MRRLQWRLNEEILVGSYKIFCADDLKKTSNGHNATLIRGNSPAKLATKFFLWPIYDTFDAFLGSKFIERAVGKWIAQLANEQTVFLDIGCGSMRLMKYLPEKVIYNGFDIAFSEFHIKRLFRKGLTPNIAFASATHIPLDSESVNLIASTEVFEHIPDIDKAMDEIRRISINGANIVCSIPNNYCYKYEKKGPHPDHVNNWTYDEFILFMKSKGFDYEKGFKKGYWIPLPTWLTDKSYQLPLCPKEEFYCTNFFYHFKICK